MAKPTLSSGERHFSGRTDQKTSLVIFDKDGTVIEYGPGWELGAFEIAKKLDEVTGLPLENKVLELFGYDVKRKKWYEGLLCDNPDTIRKVLAEFLQKEASLSSSSATDLANTTFTDRTYHTDVNQIKLVDNPLALFKTLKHYGVKSALCTSDSNTSTHKFLSHFSLTPDLLDYVFCGDDPGFKNKPNPDNISHICEKVKVPVSETVMIGDTARDMEMGKAAGVRLAVGVLSGACVRSELEGIADVVEPSLVDTMKYYLPEGCEEVYRKNL